MSNCLARLTLSALCLLGLAAPSGAQTVKMFKDIWSGKSSSNPTELTAVGSVFVFAASNSTNGREPWVTDGTRQGTKLLKDIFPGVQSSFPMRFVQAVGKVYFLADNGVHGQELWMTDGTAAGTKMAADLRPGPKTSRIEILAANSKRLWFLAEDGRNGRQIFYTAGAGITLTGKFFPNISAVRSMTSRRAATQRNGMLVFGAEVDRKVGWELYGTSGGMPKLIKNIHDSNYQSSAPEYFTAVGNLVFFVANDGKAGREIWYTGGTASSTKMLQDTLPGPASGIEKNPLVTPWTGGTAAVFFAQNQRNNELWWLDTNGASPSALLLKQIDGGFSALPKAKVFDGFVYFSANDGKTGFEPWISDGTRSGTRLLKDINTGGRHSSPIRFTYDKKSGLVFFDAYTLAHGVELWITDGKESGTRRVDDIWPGWFGSGPDYMVQLPKCGLVFVASNPNSGRELWSVGKVDPPKRVARISFKRIVNRDQKHPQNWSNSNIQQLVAGMNNVYQRDLNLTFQIAEIVDLVDPGIPDSWESFHVQNKKAMEAVAEQNPAAYKWRTDAINVYLVSRLIGADAACSGAACPANDNDIIFMAVHNHDPAIVLGHEIGHYFNLRHTHANHEPAGCSCAGGRAGDCVWDTPDDADPAACRPFTPACHLANLRKLEYTKHREDLIRFNMMSYHGGRTPSNSMFTCGQIERMDEAIEDYRRNVIVGEPVATISSVSPSAQPYPGPKTLKLTGKNLPTSGSIEVRAGDELSTSVTVSATSITANFGLPIPPGAHTISALQGGQLRVFRANGHLVTPFIKKPIDPDKNGMMTIEIRSMAKNAPMFLAAGTRMLPVHFSGVGYTLQVNPLIQLPITTNALAKHEIRFQLNTLPFNFGVWLQAVELRNGMLLTFTNPIRIVVL